MARLRLRRSSSQGSGVRQSGTDALQLVLDYVKQETLTPLKGIGRYLAFGIVGSFTLCAGLILLLVALLRALQEQTGGEFGGHLNWLPYLIVAAVALGIVAVAAWRAFKGAPARRSRGRNRGRGTEEPT